MRSWPRRLATTLVVAAASAGLLAVGLAVTDVDRGPLARGAGPEPVRRTAPPIPGERAITKLPPRTAAPGTRPLGLKWSWVQPETFGFVARAGGGWTFAEVEWCDVEPSPGVFQWSALDRTVGDARALGHRTLLKLRTGQCWATERPAAGLTRDQTENVSKDPSTPATDLAAHLAFVRAVVQRYAARGVDHYAVENEPDTVNHWAAPLADYRRTVRRVAAAIRRAHPGAHVLDGGVSSTAYGVAMAAAQLRGDPRRALRTYRSYYARRLAGDASRFPAVSGVPALREVLRTATARRAVRAVGVTTSLANAGVVDGYQLHYYEPAAQLRPVLRFLERRLRRGVPVEAWEIGTAWPGPSYAAGRQATELFRIVGVLLAAGVRPLVHLPVAYSGAPGKQQVFRGLVESDGSLLPAGSGWVALNRALGSLRGRPVQRAGGRLTGAVWRTGSREAALVWARRGSVRLGAADVRAVLDARGARVPGPPVVGRAPVLVLGSAGGQLARSLRPGR